MASKKKSTWGMFSNQGEHLGNFDCPEANIPSTEVYQSDYDDTLISFGTTINRCGMTPVSTKRDNCSRCGKYFIYP